MDLEELIQYELQNHDWTSYHDTDINMHVPTEENKELVEDAYKMNFDPDTFISFIPKAVDLLCIQEKLGRAIG